MKIKLRKTLEFDVGDRFMTSEELFHENNFDLYALINDAVANFDSRMYERMCEKRDNGCQGWDNPAFLPIYRRRMLDCAARVYAGDSDQCVDLANWAMIIDFCEQKKAGAG